MTANNTQQKLKRVCFCGRPNVGKSSLFNRLLGRKKAIVLDQPGVTRDVYRTVVDIEGVKVELADLAGLEFWDRKRLDARDKKAAENEMLKKLATEAALEYLNRSDLVIFVVDGREELTPGDEELARVVRNSGKQVLLVLSKIEGSVGEDAQAEAVKLGWGYGIPTSAEHNRGIGELKESILTELFGENWKQYATDDTAAEEQGTETQAEAETEVQAETEDELEEAAEQLAAEPRPTERGLTRDRPIRLGVYGRPNVGKSTLVNQLLGEKRMITSPIAGTTVDTVDTDFEREGKFYQILDTAGIRRKSKTEQGVEVLSVVQALKSVQDVDVALFLLDGYEGVTDQDEKVAGELIKAGKPIAIIVNKWDTCRVERDAYAQRLRDELAFLDYAPILFISAKNGAGLDGIFDLIGEMLRQRFIVAPTGELNRFLELVEGTNNPTDVRLYYASQTSKNPPTITCLVSDPKKVHFAYERYLKNELRQRYGWMGSPLRMVFKSRKRSPSKRTRGKSTRST